MQQQKKKNRDRESFKHPKLFFTQKMQANTTRTHPTKPIMLRNKRIPSLLGNSSSTTELLWKSSTTTTTRDSSTSFLTKKATLNHLQEQSLQYFQNLKIYGSITITTTCIPSKQTRISQLPQRRRRPNTNATQSFPWPFRCAKSSHSQKNLKKRATTSTTTNNNNKSKPPELLNYKFWGRRRRIWMVVVVVVVVQHHVIPLRKIFIWGKNKGDFF